MVCEGLGDVCVRTIDMAIFLGTLSFGIHIWTKKTYGIQNIVKPI